MVIYTYAVDPHRGFAIIVGMTDDGIIMRPMVVNGDAMKVVAKCASIKELHNCIGIKVRFVVDATGVGDPLSQLLDDLEPDVENVACIEMTANMVRRMEAIRDAISLLRYVDVVDVG